MTDPIDLATLTMAELKELVFDLLTQQQKSHKTYQIQINAVRKEIEKRDPEAKI